MHVVQCSDIVLVSLDILFMHVFHSKNPDIVLDYLHCM